MAQLELAGLELGQLKPGKLNLGQVGLAEVELAQLELSRLELGQGGRSGWSLAYSSWPSSFSLGLSLLSSSQPSTSLLSSSWAR